MYFVLALFAGCSLLWTDGIINLSLERVFPDLLIRASAAIGIRFPSLPWESVMPRSIACVSDNFSSKACTVVIVFHASSSLSTRSFTSLYFLCASVASFGSGGIHLGLRLGWKIESTCVHPCLRFAFHGFRDRHVNIIRGKFLCTCERLTGSCRARSIFRSHRTHESTG